MVWYLVLAWCTGAIQGTNVCSTTILPSPYGHVAQCRADGAKAVREGFGAYRCVSKANSE